MSRLRDRVARLRDRLEARGGAGGDSSAVLERLFFQDLPCDECLDAHVAACHAWRELGATAPPGRDGTSLGMLWAWSGRPSGGPEGCTSGCGLSRYLWSRPSAILGGTWHGLRVEFTGGVGPAEAVRQLRAWREAHATDLRFDALVSGTSPAETPPMALTILGPAEEPGHLANTSVGLGAMTSAASGSMARPEWGSRLRWLQGPRVLGRCEACREPILSGQEYLGANATRHARCPETPRQRL